MFSTDIPNLRQIYWWWGKCPAQGLKIKTQFSFKGLLVINMFSFIILMENSPPSLGGKKTQIHRYKNLLA
jgi:hypothetical protein